MIREGVVRERKGRRGRKGIVKDAKDKVPAILFFYNLGID
jgi:hypothetical protein